MSVSERSVRTARSAASIRSFDGSQHPSSLHGSETSQPRSLGAIRDQVAHEVAVRAIMKAKTSAGVKIGVMFLFAQSDEDSYLRLVSEALAQQHVLKDYCYVFVSSASNASSFSSSGTSVSSPTGSASPLIITASSPSYISRAVLLTSSKFLGRIDSAFEISASDGREWFCRIRGIGKHSLYDEEALWDVMRKCVEPPMDPLLPPPGSKGIDEILDAARAKLQRITPLQAYEELREPQVGAPTFLVDIRPVAQREATGGIQGSLIIERNVLEWRFDPRCDARLPIVDRYDLRVIVFCQEGYTSSLAAQALQELGLLNSTDIIGGYEAWRSAGLPVDGFKQPSITSMAASLV